MKESVKDIRAISTIKPYGKNPRSITTEDFKLLKKHIKKLDQFKPIIINQDSIILGGNMRYQAYLELGIKDVWVSEVKTKDEKEIIEYNLIDNQRYGSYNDQLLAELILPFQNDLDLQDYKVDLEMPKIDLANVLDFFGPGGVDLFDGNDKEAPKLIDKFIIPPFSVFDTRQGYWQERKRAWLSLGIESELGRGGGA